jgi:hypothetical protein
MSPMPNRGARLCLSGVRRRPHTPRRGLAALSATLVTTLAAMSTTSALALAASGAAGTGAQAESARQASAVRPLATHGELLAAEKLQSLLAGLSLKDLSTGQLVSYLAELNSVKALALLKVGPLGGELGSENVERALGEAIEQLKLDPTATLGELTGLESALQGKLGGVLESLGLLLKPEQQKTLEDAVSSLGLSSLDLDELVSTMLKSAKPEGSLADELATLAGGLFQALGSEQLQGLLGSAPGGFVPKSVEEVAKELNTTSTAVSEELGQTTESLPPGTTMLTAPLTKGKLAVAPAAKGLLTGVLGDLSEVTEDGEGGGSGEGNGSGSSGSGSGGSGSGSGGSGSGGSGAAGGGGQGGPGGSGSGGSGGSTTLMLTVPGASASQGVASGRSATVTAKPGKVSVVSREVRGQFATLVLRVPSAGTAIITGRDVRGASKQSARAERLTLRVELTKASIASLRHRRRLAVRLKVAFHPTAGSSSSASVTVVFA